MRETDHTTENTPVESFYQTGDIRPQKSYRGIIALLLIAVIFLGSLVTALSLMNIHLFRMLKRQEHADGQVRFVANATAMENSAEPHEQVSDLLGLTGCDLTSFDQNYYDLPAGIYVTDVAANSAAHRSGICTGDILLQLDGSPICDMQTLDALLSDIPGGNVVRLIIYRTGTQRQLEIQLDQ